MLDYFCINSSRKKDREIYFCLTSFSINIYLNKKFGPLEIYSPLAREK